MAKQAAYDEIADWYETEFLEQQRGTDPIGVTRALRETLGAAPAAGGLCLEIGCGTGEYAATDRTLGWTPIGVDLSAGMLRHAHALGRLPVAQADAEHLPIRSASVDAVTTVMTHTDMPGYPAVLAEAFRVLRPGGILAHVGVHPCFCGGFADRESPTAIVIGPGYVDGHWTKASWTKDGVRDKVGAQHWPLPELLNMFGGVGFVLERFTEGGEPTPMVFAVRARKPVARPIE
jgi:SAM-dependent methyltransferase